jgi:hypothetical protein
VEGRNGTIVVVLPVVAAAWGRARVEQVGHVDVPAVDQRGAAGEEDVHGHGLGSGLVLLGSHAQVVHKHVVRAIGGPLRGRLTVCCVNTISLLMGNELHNYPSMFF